MLLNLICSASLWLMTLSYLKLVCYRLHFISQKQKDQMMLSFCWPGRFKCSRLSCLSRVNTSIAWIWSFCLSLCFCRRVCSTRSRARSLATLCNRLLVFLKLLFTIRSDLPSYERSTATERNTSFSCFTSQPSFIKRPAQKALSVVIRLLLSF